MNSKNEGLAIAVSFAYNALEAIVYVKSGQLIGDIATDEQLDSIGKAAAEVVVEVSSTTPHEQPLYTNTLKSSLMDAMEEKAEWLLNTSDSSEEE